MRKLLAILLVVILVLSLVGCTGGSGTTNQSTASTASGSTATTEKPSSTEKKPGSVNLSIMLALGQWTDKFDAMIDAYKAENPQIDKIENEFPSSSTYWDLLKSKLASGQMPDIYGCGFGEQISNWTEYLADLSDIPAAADLTAAQVSACSLDGKKIQVFPLVVEGWGILYNMRLLKQVGWETPPTTISQMKQL